TGLAIHFGTGLLIGDVVLADGLPAHSARIDDCAYAAIVWGGRVGRVGVVLSPAAVAGSVVAESFRDRRKVARGLERGHIVELDGDGFCPFGHAPRRVRAERSHRIRRLIK